MTTTTSDRPLPLDLATLRAHYFPPEPTTEVSRTQGAIDRIDRVITAVREEITRRDEQDRRLVSDLISAALTADKLEPIAARMAPADRPTLEHRFQQLETARLAASHQMTRAQGADPVYLRWKRTCEHITEEWRQCIDFHERDSDTDRLQRLSDFATTH